MAAELMLELVCDILLRHAWTDGVKQGIEREHGDAAGLADRVELLRRLLRTHLGEVGRSLLVFALRVAALHTEEVLVGKVCPVDADGLGCQLCKHHARILAVAVCPLLPEHALIAFRFLGDLRRIAGVRDEARTFGRQHDDSDPCLAREAGKV